MQGCYERIHQGKIDSERAIYGGKKGILLAFSSSEFLQF